MTTVRKVQQAPTPQKAMLALAEALDRIEAKLDQQPAAPADVWGEWSVAAVPHPEHPDYVSVPAKDESREETRLRAIELVERQMEGTTGEDRRALEAKLRLLKDDGAAIVQKETGVRVQSVSGDGKVTVHIPPASFERQATRYDFAVECDLHAFLSKPVLSKAEFVYAYVKGGPMWLYLGDRDAIMGMPPQYRVDMIADIEQDSPAQAQEVARDILMDRGVEGTEAVARVYSE